MSEFALTATTTLGLITLAELGDKSQLVCMTLAARQRALPVLLGTVLAFAVLNLLAVLFGAALANWLPGWIVAAAVTVLFAIFGIRAWHDGAGGLEEVEAKSGSSVLLSALLLIFMAEFGDKTQLTVAGLAGTAPALPVWLGATLALTLTSVLAVAAGRTLLQRLPLALLNRLSGVLFLILAVFAAGHALVVLSN